MERENSLWEKYSHSAIQRDISIFDLNLFDMAFDVEVISKAVPQEIEGHYDEKDGKAGKGGQVRC